MLCADQRRVHDPAGLARHLTDDAEELAQAAQAVPQQIFQVGDQDFVLAEELLELVAARFEARAACFHVPQESRLLGLVGAELRLPLLIDLARLATALDGVFEQVVDRARALLRKRGADQEGRCRGPWR